MSRQRGKYTQLRPGAVKLVGMPPDLAAWLFVAALSIASGRQSIESLIDALAALDA